MNEKKGLKHSSIERSIWLEGSDCQRPFFIFLQAIRHLLNIISFVALSRLLSPNDFGI